MKIIHIESGLGNQMLSFCELLALQQVNPYEKLYIETLIYDIPEANDYICQWNGYELNRIFGIKSPNVRELFSEVQWEQILQDVTKSEFWKKSWNYPIYIVEALNKHGLQIKNIRGDFEKANMGYTIASKGKEPLSHKIKQTGIYTNIRNIWIKANYDKYFPSDKEMLFYEGDEDVFTGQRLTFKKRNNDIERIEKDIKSAFKFPEHWDVRNIELQKKLMSTESVAIHARRGDMLTSNGKYYKNGYFKRAVKFIKKNVSRPSFYFFCDPGSIPWCKDNLDVFSLDSSDEIIFVDWNSGLESFRDMQLMASCKHNIVTNSSFGWWGAYLNENPMKITISPEIDINTTHHF